MKGYEVTPRFDKNKKFAGYTISKNASVFKASEIGRRNMASQLEASWEFLQTDVFSQRVCEKKGKSLGQSRVLHYLRSEIETFMADWSPLFRPSPFKKVDS